MIPDKADVETGIVRHKAASAGKRCKPLQHLARRRRTDEHLGIDAGQFRDVGRDQNTVVYERLEPIDDHAAGDLDGANFNDICVFRFQAGGLDVEHNIGLADINELTIRQQIPLDAEDRFDAGFFAAFAASGKACTTP